MHKVGTESDEPWLPHSETSIATSLALLFLIADKTACIALYSSLNNVHVQSPHNKLEVSYSLKLRVLERTIKIISI